MKKPLNKKAHECVAHMVKKCPTAKGLALMQLVRQRVPFLCVSVSLTFHMCTRS